MNILRNIFEGNVEAIKKHYSLNSPRDIEISLAFYLYSTSKDFLSLKTLHLVSESYFDPNNSFRKENLAYFIDTYVKLDLQFFDYMKNTNFFSSFLKEYGSNIQEKINISKIENEKNQNSLININDLNKINEIISKHEVLENKKTIPQPIPFASYPLDLRLCHLNTSTNNKYLKPIQDDLLINVFSYFKAKNIPHTYLDKFIEKTKKIRDDLAQNSTENINTFSPLIYCIHADIISVIGKKENLDKTFNYTNLWTDITKYDLSNILQAELKTIDIPVNLKDVVNEKKVKEAIWVLTIDGEIALSSTNKKPNQRAVHHIDLANGKDVISAGMILFSEDMKKVIAINPGSGHYKPSADSCIHMQKIIEKSFFDTKNLIMCDDYSWKPKVEIAPTIKPISINMDIINKNISLIKKNGLKESIDNTKVLPKFNKK